MEQILLTISYVEEEEFQKGGKLYFWPKNRHPSLHPWIIFWTLQLLSLFEKRGSGTHYKFIIIIQCKTGYLLSPNHSRCYSF